MLYSTSLLHLNNKLYNYCSFVSNLTNFVPTYSLSLSDNGNGIRLSVQDSPHWGRGSRQNQHCPEVHRWNLHLGRNPHHRSRFLHQDSPDWKQCCQSKGSLAFLRSSLLPAFCSMCNWFCLLLWVYIGSMAKVLWLSECGFNHALHIMSVYSGKGLEESYVRS